MSPQHLSSKMLVGQMTFDEKTEEPWEKWDLLKFNHFSSELGNLSKTLKPQFVSEFKKRKKQTKNVEFKATKTKHLWQNTLSWERMLRRQWNGRICDPPKMLNSLLIVLICFAKNTQVSFFTNGHFQPMPFHFLPNTPPLTLLICCSLSLFPTLSAYSPISFHLLQTHINTPMIL